MDYRYERKMFIENINRKNVEILIKTHSAFFREIYYPRTVNNIYFDTINFNNFQDNIIGNVNRLKYRIRWYGDLFNKIENAKLELKIKKGIVGTKRIFNLNDFVFKKKISSRGLVNVILNSEIDKLVKLEIRSQTPVILNRYKRSYFESLDKKFRITVDDSQEFYKINKLNNIFNTKVKDDCNVILELKYNVEDNLEAQEVLKEFPFRITKSSKYSRGVEHFYV